MSLLREPSKVGLRRVPISGVSPVLPVGLTRLNRIMIILNPKIPKQITEPSGLGNSVNPDEWDLQDQFPKALRTPILRLLGPKTILYRAFGLF